MDSKMTVGVEFANRLLAINEHQVMAQIWDTAGQDRFISVTNMLVTLLLTFFFILIPFLGIIVELLALC